MVGFLTFLWATEWFWVLGNHHSGLSMMHSKTNQTCDLPVWGQGLCWMPDCLSMLHTHTHSSNNTLVLTCFLLKRWACCGPEERQRQASPSDPLLLHVFPSGPPLTRTIQPLNRDGEGHKAQQTVQCVMIKCFAGERRRRRGRLTQWEHGAQLNADSPRLSKSEKGRSICRARESRKASCVLGTIFSKLRRDQMKNNPP